MIVSEKGVLSFQWSNPYEYCGIVNENVELMDFDSISKDMSRLFKAGLKYDYKSDMYLKLTKATLTLATQRQKDSKDIYLVPAWVCCMTYYYDYETESSFRGRGDYVTIAFNAIDGTRILMRNVPKR